MQRGTLDMPQAQKHLSKTLLYLTDTGGFSNEALILTKPSFYVPTKNKNYSTAVSPVDPSHGALGIRAWLSWGLVHVQIGLGAAEPCGPVQAEQRLAVIGREAPSIGMGTDEGQRGSLGGLGCPSTRLSLLPPLQHSP